MTDRDIKGGHEAILHIINTKRRSFPDIKAQVEILMEGEMRDAW